MSSALHISIAAEPLFNLGPLAATNSLLTSWLVVLSLSLLAIYVGKNLRKIPSYLQILIEIPVSGIYDLANNITGTRAKVFFPFVFTAFIYIIFSNWAGLIPGVGTIFLKIGEHGVEKAPLLRAPTADINTTLALALLSVGLVQYYGLKTLKMEYVKKFFNFKNPILTFVGILELVSEISKIISFAFRLFGNIFAGEVLLVVTSFLVPFLVPAPFYGLELFVGFIQALVFSMLTLVFLNLATTHAEH
ncbi:F0F1 ATP synthase subunit A [Candidatus Collierbacteria bacterium]|nr:F0F1 ATP synthase subunit A [Candidatus Collierbacteria bacterium]